MPSVNPGESREHYVSRCVAYIMHVEGERDASHAAAKCHGVYDQHLKKQKEGE